MPKKTPETVGQRIKRYREEKGMSQNALAVETGIAKSYLWSLEKDSTATRPSAESLYKIAKALGVTMSALLGRELLTDPPEGVPPGLAEFARTTSCRTAMYRCLPAFSSAANVRRRKNGGPTSTTQSE